MTMLKKSVFVLMLALTIGLAGCSSKIEGTFEADISTIKNKNAANIIAMVKPRLVFSDEGVFMKATIFGQEKSDKLEAVFEGKQVTLTKKGEKEKMVLKLTDSNTLTCVQCPKMMPGAWKKK